jgi:DNA-binding CsgD family transcriptional regulator
MSLSEHLRALGAELDSSLERLDLAMLVVDRSGRILWQNPASVGLVGARQGSHFMTVVAPVFVHQAQTSFSRKLLGVDGATSRQLVVVGPDGERKRVESSAVTIESGGEVVGVFGIARPLADEQPPPRVRLTPREHETLSLLAAGLSTDEIAARLGVTRETARNYIRRVLRALDVRSRLEAVVRGRELGLT